MLFDTTPKILDSTAPFDVLAKNGYYQVGENFFNHKANALIQASQNNKPVQWHFNDHIWKNFDWKKDDCLPVEYWYQQRAQQLREKYDYLILAFSGGADSHNILHSFIKNKIHLDEVWCDWPLAHTHGKFDQNSQNFDVSNMPSEWTYSIKPELDRLSKTNPEILINITDSTKNLEDEYEDDTVITTQYCFYATVKRYRFLDQILKQRYKKHQRIAVIMGFEKPRCIIINGFLSCHFDDLNIHVKSDSRGDCVRNLEFFYWSSDMPELIRSQAHSILNYLRIDRSAWEYQVQGKIINSQAITSEDIDVYSQRKLRKMLNRAIYPHWNSDTFQVHKNTSTLYNNEVYTWLKKDYSDHRALQSHRSALNSHYALIHDRYFVKDPVTNEKLNYKEFCTKFFPVGKVTDFIV
jgi:hypothetical protein